MVCSWYAATGKYLDARRFQLATRDESGKFHSVHVFRLSCYFKITTACGKMFYCLGDIDIPE